MLLDAALGLYVFGAIFLIAVALLLVAVGFAIAQGLRLRRTGRNKTSLLFLLPAIGVLTSVAVLPFLILSDTRADQQIVLDLRKSPLDLSNEVKDVCPFTRQNTDIPGVLDTSFCDTQNRRIRVRAVLNDGSELHADAATMFWYGDAHRVKSITIMGKSMPLQAGHELLMERAAVFAKGADAKTAEAIRDSSDWVLACCKDNAVYSDTKWLLLQPQLAIQFRKNVDKVAVDYVLKPSP